MEEANGHSMTTEKKEKKRFSCYNIKFLHTNDLCLLISPFLMENYDHPIFVSCNHTLKCCLHNHIEVEVGFPRIYVPTKKEDAIQKLMLYKPIMGSLYLLVFPLNFNSTDLGEF